MACSDVVVQNIIDVRVAYFVDRAEVLAKPFEDEPTCLLLVTGLKGLMESSQEKRQGSPASLERGGIAASPAVVAISIIAMKRTTIAHRDSFYAPMCGSQIKRSRCSC
jgi:hypothetical protein